MYSENCFVEWRALRTHHNRARDNVQASDLNQPFWPADAVNDLVDSASKREAVAVVLGVPVDHVVKLHKCVATALNSMEVTGAKTAIPLLPGGHFWRSARCCSFSSSNYTISAHLPALTSLSHGYLQGKAHRRARGL